ncbi:vWA domain-containing protein [Foetidibacter luteolus]|uniref:vWA domain-containing protein n=1 Tax=Foetidibacter luteolus TaxID=2608880 RepID=UPI00129BFAD4|nr:VWA domain-containing protein [Foetidibacter luteolus]
MKKLLLAAILGCCISACYPQYYLRGEVHDELGRSLSNVHIYLSSRGTYPFKTGSYGTFGIPLTVKSDSIFLQLQGYEPVRKRVEANKYQSFVMKATQAGASITRHKLSSFTKNLLDGNNNRDYSFNESYTRLVENDFIEADRFAETGFALTTDRASFSNIRRFINMNEKVPCDAVRIEEMLNYFHFDDTDLPVTEGRFACRAKLFPAPWNSRNKLLFVQMKAPKINLDTVPPTNLVFLIDVSGSMDMPNRLPLIQAGLKLLVENLRSQDTVAIVVYGGSVGIMLQPTSGADKKQITDVIDRLSPGGDTPGEAAIKTAYALAGRSFNRNGNNRVIIATDGDFNVGQTTEEELEKLITRQQQTGIYLTCLGVGMGNYKDSKLEALAKKGNGNFAYIDNYQEAEKVLIQEFAKTIYTVADDAFLNVKFNPLLVREYRLIGYNNRSDALKDDNMPEGGSVGSGHTVMGVFEIVPSQDAAGDSAVLNSKPVATMQLRFRKHLNDRLIIQEFSVFNNQPGSQAGYTEKLATSLIMFGNLLRESGFAKAYTWDDALKFTNQYINRQNAAEAELAGMMDKAKKIYSKKRKRG